MVINGAPLEQEMLSQGIEERWDPGPALSSLPVGHASAMAGVQEKASLSSVLGSTAQGATQDSAGDSCAESQVFM